MARIQAARPERRRRATINATVGFDEVNGARKLSRRNFRKAGGHTCVLKRQIVQAFARDPPPARQPVPAKAAVAVVNQQRSARRPGNVSGDFHEASLAGNGRSSSLRREDGCDEATQDIRQRGG